MDVLTSISLLDLKIRIINKFKIVDKEILIYYLNQNIENDEQLKDILINVVVDKF